MWSTTPGRLSGFVGALLDVGVPSTKARSVQLAFREHGFYPARDLPEFCTPSPPDIFFSYHSAQDIVDIETIVWKALGYAEEQLRRSRSDLDDVDLRPLFSDEIRVWVDFMFINQAARDLREELDVLPRLLKHADVHFVLGDRPLTRAWCCYEIALFNEELAHTDAPTFPGMVGAQLRSFIAPSLNIYRGWEAAATSEAEDKAFIRDRISATFPDGFGGFDHVMAQASAVAVLPLTERSTWSTPAADECLARAVERWYGRWIATQSRLG